MAAAIHRWAPPGSPYLSEAQRVIGLREAFALNELGSITKALRADYAAGAITTIQELLHAELFDDFLAMAENLVGEGYYVAAAVLAGSVLEEHAQKLASKAGVSLTDAQGRPKSMETLGIDLRKAGTISEPERKILQAWYGQRTEAAHGRPQNVVEQEVHSMIPGVRDFMVRHPA
ncbi:MAG: hypothetical protein JWO74_3130 [Solirubrobacterales bacterium]|nr:hypothetical protein [Solirubrobacterales bacterium]